VRSSLSSILVCALSIVGCASEPDGSSAPVGGSVACIVGGSADETFLSLTPAEADAIVRIELTTTVGPRMDFGTCSGVAIAPRWLITARHCVSELEDTTALVMFGGASACDASRAVDAERLIEHPNLDVSLLQIPFGRTGIFTPASYGDENGVKSGQLVEIAGFGRTEDGGAARRFAVEEVTHVDDTSISVAGDRSGACLGDSGGPLLTRDSSGRVVALGILSQGSRDCMGTDTYVRLSSVREWLDEQLTL
jgi:hypothetical protein